MTQCLLSSTHVLCAMQSVQFGYLVCHGRRPPYSRLPDPLPMQHYFVLLLQRLTQQSQLASQDINSLLQQLQIAEAESRSLLEELEAKRLARRLLGMRAANCRAYCQTARLVKGSEA